MNEPRTILLHNNPAILQTMVADLDPSFYEMALYKALELLSHQMRYKLGLPYVGGRSDAMQSLQDDTDGQAPDDGQPVVEEAKQLVSELAEARVESLSAEAECLAEELANEMAELNALGEEDNDSQTASADSEGCDDDDVADDGDNTSAVDDDSDDSDDHVDSVMECTDLALDTLNALVEGFLTCSNAEHLNPLAYINFSEYSGYSLCSFDKAGLVTIRLKK